MKNPYIIIGLVCFLLLGISYFLFTDSSKKKTHKKSSQLDEIQKISYESNFFFPCNSKIVKYRETTDFEPEWVVKIKVPEKKLDSVLRQAKSKTTRNQLTKGPIAYAKSTSWWKPVKIVLDKFYLEDTSGALIYIVISKENADVYIYMHHMII